MAPEVIKAIEEVYINGYGNPSSPHRFGQKARSLLCSSCRTLASFLDVNEEEIFITSGATEALNTLLTGFPLNGHVISSHIEHQAVLHPLRRLEKKGAFVTYLKPEEGKGSLHAFQVEKAIRPDTKLVVLMAVNNETGIKNDIEEIAKLCAHHGIAFIVDGVALLGKEMFHIPPGVSAMCFSSHKIHGPPALGLAFVRKRVKIEPLIIGGPQQRGRRAGTENVAGIVGFAKAFELLSEALPEATKKMERLRNKLEEGIARNIPNVIIHGKNEKRICNVSNIAFPGIDGEILLMRLDMKGIAVSMGAACATGGLEPSHVLLNMGISQELATSSLRFSLSRYTIEEEIDTTIAAVAEIVKN